LCEQKKEKNPPKKYLKLEQRRYFFIIFEPREIVRNECCPPTANPGDLFRALIMGGDQ
jgi:hypothetical protein